MITIDVPTCAEGTQLVHICIDIPEGHFASGPLPLTGGTPAEPIVVKHEVLNLDEFSSVNGWGEHPCQHDHVDGSLLLDFDRVNTQDLSSAGWSPRWTSNTCFFPKLIGRKVSGCWVLPSITSPYEEWAGLALSFAAFHGAAVGSITPETIELTVAEAVWFRSGYDPAGNHCVHYSLQRTGDPDSYTYEGTRAVGHVRYDLRPQAFPGEPVNPSVEPYTITAYVSNGMEAVDGVTAALQEVYRLGVLDAVALKAMEGSAVRSFLSATEDAIEAMEPVTVLTSNNVENAVQATDIAGAIAPLRVAVDLARNVRDVDQWVVSAGELILWYKYVAKPTYQDVSEGIKAYRTTAKSALGQLKPGSYRASSRSERMGWQCRTAAKVTLHPYASDAITRCLNTLDNIGVLPTTARMWDLVPYSFVVDWVVNVQSCLRAIDINAFSYRYQIDECTWSTKATLRGWIPPGFSSDILTCSGIDFSFYTRCVGPMIPIDPTVNLRGLTTAGHTLAGSALLVCNTL